MVDRLEQVSCKETRRIRFWFWVNGFTEAQWLKAHGWTETRAGWLLPHWHPNLQKEVRRNVVRSKMMAMKLNLTSTPGSNEWAPFTNRAPRNAIVEIGEPYDLNHALNSQRAHTRVQTVAMLPKPEHKAPIFPSYVTWRPLQLSVVGLANVFGIASLLFRGHWSSYLYLLSSIMLIGLSFAIAWKTRRDWELDWAERQLQRGKS